MNSLILEEKVSYSRVQELINNPILDSNQVKQLKKYLKSYNKSKQAFNVHYNPSSIDLGRKYADQGLSLQSFKKNIRQTLVYDTHIDIDIENCHVVILSQYCKKNMVMCDMINTFNQERSSRLQEIMTKCGVCRKVAKELILTIMYLGQIPDYCSENGFNDVPPEWVDDLQKEFIRIADWIVYKNQDLYKKVKKMKKKEFKNEVSSTMSYVIQIIEDELIMNARSKLLDMGYSVDCLCFDGLIIQKADITNDQLEELNAYCFDKTGYAVSFIIKPMEKLIELSEDKIYDFSEYDFKHLDYFNQLYMGRLENDTPEGTYQLRKTYVEHFMCKIQSPDTCFIFQNGEDKAPYIYSSISLSALLKPVQSGCLNNMGNPIGFYDKWTNDLEQRIYRKYDFIPYNITPPEDTDIYNMFTGMNQNIYTGDTIDYHLKENEVILNKKIKPYLDLCQSLCGGDDEHAMYFHKFIGQMFQEPTKRPPIAILFKGKQGTGKNLILDAIGNMIAKEHYITSSKPTDFFGDHAEGAYRKLLININEAEGKDTFQNEGQFKSFITEDTMTMNPKFVRPTEISNFARLIITSNKPNPIPIDVKSKDRRYVVFQTTDDYLKYSADFWTKLYAHFRKPDFMYALHFWFLKLDLTGFDWIKQRPITKAYKDMCNMFSPTEALFFEDYINNTLWIDGSNVNLDDEVKLTTMDLFEAYEVYCKKNRFTKENNSPNIRAFAGRLVDMEFPIVKYKSSGMMWKFTPSELYRFMEKKKWINNYDDEEEEECNEVGEDVDDSYFD
tara:strand:- start:144 stop:2489 length:2346 start_codon:yes stop_codon:yes gene_type:complete